VSPDVLLKFYGIYVGECIDELEITEGKTAELEGFGSLDELGEETVLVVERTAGAAGTVVTIGMRWALETGAAEVGVLVTPVAEHTGIGFFVVDGGIAAVAPAVFLVLLGTHHTTSECPICRAVPTGSAEGNC
jgi:hypothetical protein